MTDTRRPPMGTDESVGLTLGRKQAAARGPDLCGCRTDYAHAVGQRDLVEFERSSDTL
jgi:hypothetical protein